MTEVPTTFTRGLLDGLKDSMEFYGRPLWETVDLCEGGRLGDFYLHMEEGML